MLQSFHVSGTLWDKTDTIVKAKGKDVTRSTTLQPGQTHNREKWEMFLEYFPTDFGDPGAVISGNEGNFCSMYQTSF